MILTLFILLLTLSLIMAIDPKNVKINNESKPYISRVFYSFLALLIALLIMSWFILLPVIGILALV